ncbi:MAG: hypothetical protein V3W41_06355 [Planctomycetota bacterium]
MSDLKTASKDAAGDEALSAVAKKTKEVKHLDDRLMADYLARKLGASEEKNVRRHVLFCTTCSSKVIRETRKRKVEAAAAYMPAAETKRDSASPSAPVAPAAQQIERKAIQARAWGAQRQRRILRQVTSATAFAIVLAFAAIVWAPSFESPPAAAREIQPAHVELAVLGPSARTLETDLFFGEEFTVKITAPGVHERHIYVLALGPHGELVALAPNRGQLGQSSEFVATQLLLPASARRAEPRGYRLHRAFELKPQDHLAIVVISSTASLALLEGRVRDEVTLAALAKDLLEGETDSVDESVARILVSRIEEQFQTEAVHLFPLVVGG